MVKNQAWEAYIFPGGSDGRESAYNAEDLSSIPGWGRSPGEGNGNTLQYSCQDRGAWQATVHEAVNSQTWLSGLHFTAFHFLGTGSLTWHIKKYSDYCGQEVTFIPESQHDDCFIFCNQLPTLEINDIGCSFNKCFQYLVCSVCSVGARDFVALKIASGSCCHKLTFQWREIHSK